MGPKNLRHASLAIDMKNCHTNMCGNILGSIFSVKENHITRKWGNRPGKHLIAPEKRLRLVTDFALTPMGEFSVKGLPETHTKLFLAYCL